MTPLELAQLIDRADKPIARDPDTGIYLVRTGQLVVPLTLAQMESGLKVLKLREKAVAS